MKVNLTISTKISARTKLTESMALKLAEELLPGKDFVRVEGGKYVYLVVWENRGKEEYGEWVVYRLGTCVRCGGDTLGSGDYCTVCLSWKLGQDEGYYSVESIVEFVERAVGVLGKVDAGRIVGE